MQRIGFVIRVKPDKLEEYKRIHSDVWPELLAELKIAGMRNYSLWLRPDGTEFGYLETDDWDAACDYLAKSEVHTLWQLHMQNYLESGANEAEGGQPVEMLPMSFLME